MLFRKQSSRAEDAIAEQVAPLNEAETAWVTRNVDDARALLAGTGIRAEGELSPEALDELWALLLADDPQDPNPTINLVGLAFGQLLVDRLGLSWVAVSDEHGVEVAVRGSSDLTVFPTNLVGKRYPARETGFLAPLYEEILRTAAGLPSANP